MNELIEKMKSKYYESTHDRRSVQSNFYRKNYLVHAVILVPLLLLLAIIIDKITLLPLEILVIISFIIALAISDHMAQKKCHGEFEMNDEEK